MISPPDSVSSDGSTSTDGFDRTIGARTESQMTSTSSVLTNYSKSLEERGQSHEILSGKVAPEEQTKSSENVETLVVTLETPHSRVRQEFVSVETLRTYHIDHYIDIVRKCIFLLIFTLTFDRTQNT